MPSKPVVARVAVKPEHIFLVAYVPAPGQAVVNRLATGETIHAALQPVRLEHREVEIIHATSLAVMLAAVDTVRNMAKRQGIDILS